MNPIHDIASRARRRLILIDALSTVTICLGVAIGALVLVRGVQKLFPTLVVPWDVVLIAAPALAIVTGVVWAVVRAPSALKAARIIDERAGLRETISTALVIERDESGWSKAVLEDAREKASRVQLRTALPVGAPKCWGAPVLAALALLAVWWLPTRDLMNLLEKQQEEQQELQRVGEITTAVNESQEQLKQILEQTKLDLDDEDLSELDDLLKGDEAEFIEPEESLRSAIKNLTSVSDKLEEKRNDENGRAFDAIKDAMQALETDKDDTAAEMARAMSRGDFSEARKKLQELHEQINSGEMTEAQREQMAETLAQVQQQLEQLAQGSQSLQEQLEKAGISQQEAQQLARDPNALEQKLQEMGIPSDQARALTQAAQAQQRATDAASAMSESMSQMAQGMQNQDQSQAQQGAESMSEQLSALENMQSEMQSLENAMQQTQQQLQQLAECQNPGMGNSPSDQMAQGNGVGGLQAGSGGVPDFGGEPNQPQGDYALSREQTRVNIQEGGPIIASTLVQGAQVKGESTAAFSSAVKSAKTKASEAIETKRVPREYESAVQKYFGRLEEDAAAAEKSNPAPDPELTSESKDD
jgi:hypothetical protein